MPGATDLTDAALDAVAAAAAAVLADPAPRSPISAADSAALRLTDRSMIGGRRAWTQRPTPQAFRYGPGYSFVMDGWVVARR